MKFSSILISYLNKSSNLYDQKTHTSGASIKFLITSNPEGSYAMLTKSGEIKEDAAIKLSESENSFNVLNVINIDKKTLDIFESWREDTIIPKSKMGESGNLQVEYDYGTICFPMHICLHEITHVANYHVFSEAFNDMISYYLKQSKNSINVISEAKPINVPEPLIYQRYRKSREVFFLYPFNNFVRAWAEVEAGSAGYFAAFFTMIYLLSLLNRFLSYSASYKNYSVDILNKLDDPYAYLFTSISDLIIEMENQDSSVSQDVNKSRGRKHYSKAESWKNFVDKTKTVLYTKCYTKLTSDLNNKGGEIINNVSNIISSIFPSDYNYGFFRAAKVFFATDEGSVLYPDFINLIAAGLSNEIAYYYVYNFTYNKSFLENFSNRFYKLKKEFQEYISQPSDGGNKIKSFIERKRTEILDLVNYIFLEIAKKVIADAYGDVNVASDYTSGWFNAISSYASLLQTVCFMDLNWDLLLSRKESYEGNCKVSKLYSFVKNIIYTGDEKTEAYNDAVDLTSSIYHICGANPHYVYNALESKTLEYMQSNFKLSKGDIIAINTYTEVKPIAGDASTNAKLYNETINAARRMDYEHVASYVNSIMKTKRMHMKHTGSVFVLVAFFAIKACEWQSKITLEIDYRKFINMDTTDFSEMLHNLNQYVRFLYDVAKNMKSSYQNEIRSVLNSTNSLGVRNATAFNAALDIIFPANFSDIVLLYKAVGAQMRITEFHYEFYNRLYDGHYGDIRSLVAEKEKLLEELNNKNNKLEKNQEEVDAIKKRIRELQKDIDAMFKSAVFSYIGELDEIDTLVEIMKNKNNKRDREKEMKELIYQILIGMIHKKVKFEKIFIAINEITALYEMFGDDVVDIIKAQYEKYIIDINSLSPNVKNEINKKIEIYNDIVNTLPEQKEQLLQKYPDYAKDIEKMYDILKPLNESA